MVRKKYFFKVSALPGNFDSIQGILHYQPKVREKSGNFEETDYELQKISRIKAFSVCSLCSEFAIN